MIGSFGYKVYSEISIRRRKIDGLFPNFTVNFIDKFTKKDILGQLGKYDM